MRPRKVKQHEASIGKRTVPIEVRVTWSLIKEKKTLRYWLLISTILEMKLQCWWLSATIPELLSLIDKAGSPSSLKW